MPLVSSLGRQDRCESMSGIESVASSDDPMAAVLEYVTAFNNGDATAMAAACANPMQILDVISPHVWQGPTAAEDWWRDTVAKVEHAGASGVHIVLDEPKHVDVNGDYAYVVVPATLTFDLTAKGSPKPAPSLPWRFARSAPIGV